MRLGAYEITTLLGEGGMGQVYRATDTNLKRQVAIKVLPAALAGDTERLARLQREAELLAALNHPHIAQIYGLEKSEGTTALVMEFVDGDDLSSRIAQGALSIEDALPIAKQIAEALEAAHEQGIVHRDLKPANIKVRADGTVKVLDFGIAKALDPVDATPAASQAPTITTPAMTNAGMILGTAAYLSPEQARGKVVDRRTDIWAFGCVLFEMLTGQRAFKGEDVTDTLALVVRGEPDWNALPKGLSPTLASYLRRCLHKDPKQRVHDIGDVRLAIEGAFDPVTTTTAPMVPLPFVMRPSVVAALVVLTVLSVALAGWSLFRRGPANAHPPIRLTVALLPDEDMDITSFLTPGVALSPDGRVLVYAAKRNGVAQLYRRPLDQFLSTPIAGTDGAALPFFSPDGQWIGFFAGGAMKKIPSAGGEAITVSKANTGPSQASWVTDDAIVYSQFTNGAVVRRASAAGGDGSPLTTLNPARGDISHLTPEVLPQAKAFLFSAFPAGKILAHSIADGTEKEVIDGVSARYVTSGHLAFVRGTSLWAVPFNAERLEVTGPAARLAEGIVGTPAISQDGTLVYVSGIPSRMRLVWVSRRGVEEDAGLEPADFFDVALSPDGRRVLTSRGSYSDRIELWIGDFVRRTVTRLTTEAGINAFPLWTPDGTSVVYSATLEGGRNIFRRLADGSGKPERLTRSTNQQSAWTWSKDGRTLVLNEMREKSGYDLVTVPADGGESSVLIGGPSSERTPAISPDGRWIAYQTSDSGTTEIVVRRFPNVNDHRWQISTGGGGEPKWSANGRELFYRRGSEVMAVQIGDDPGAAKPEKLFEGDYVRSGGEKSWDVAPDGRFLMRKPVRSQYTINVVLNWTEELKARVPIK